MIARERTDAGDVSEGGGGACRRRRRRRMRRRGWEGKHVVRQKRNERVGLFFASVAIIHQR